MVGQPRDGKSNTRYFLRFAGTATLLVSGTLVLVLYILPQRYILSSGFREGSLVLPDPSMPFEPLDAARIAALPPRPLPGEGEPGPAEVFWARVTPLLNAGRYTAAIPLFASYLGDFPDDRSVRREYAITLAAAGYGERALPLLAALLAERDDPGLRLVYARILRDQGRLDDAHREYATLSAGRPEDQALWLEWAQAHSWTERYTDAEAVLLEALELHPQSIPLRIELARIYYATDRLEEASGLLARMSDTELMEAGALGLRDDILQALAPIPGPEAPPPPPPTTLEQALTAREADDLDRAEALFALALEEDPQSVAVWEAWADFLQYEREDFEGALEALSEVERLRDEEDLSLQYRMAQLEIWTGRTESARHRLRLLVLSADADAASRADALALLGDLERWDADRLAAVRLYEESLAEQPGHPGALEGLRVLRAEVAQERIEAEQPRLGAVVESLSDTDGFTRLDVGSEWTGIHEEWVWATTAGGRFVEGLDLSGVDANEQGLFVDVEGARWWRWGTIRTAVHVGMQTIRAGEIDGAAGASIRLLGPAGRRTDLRYDHEPAYGVANTLQSVLARVRQDGMSLAHAQPLGERWVGSATAAVASLDHVEMPATDRNTRAQASLGVGRIVSRELTLGVSTRVLHYTEAAPTVGGFPLYWDPRASVSAGPYARYTRPVTGAWNLRAVVNPGVAWIDERSTDGSEWVPDLSARLGMVRDGPRFRALVEFFYGQGRFTGYRSYGVNVSFSGRGFEGRR